MDFIAIFNLKFILKIFQGAAVSVDHRGVCLDVWTITQKLKHSVTQNGLQTLFQYNKAFQPMSVDWYGGFAVAS